MVRTSRFLRWLKELGRKKPPRSIMDRGSDQTIWAFGHDGNIDYSSRVLVKLCFAYVVDVEYRFTFRPTDSLSWIDRQFFPNGNDDFLELTCFVDDIRISWQLQLGVKIDDVTLADIIEAIRSDIRSIK